MGVEITSTTDSQEAVTHAMGLAPQETTEETKETAPSEEVEQELESQESDSTEETEEEETSEESDEESSEEESEENDDSDTSEEDEDNDEDKPKRKRRGGYKRRVQKLSQRLTDAEKEAEYWRREAMKRQEPQKNAGGNEQGEAKHETAGRPDPDTFDTQEEYFEALTDWKVEQKLSKQKADQKIEAQNNELEGKYHELQESVKAFKEEHDDFEDLLLDVNHIPISPAMQELILHSDDGPALMYELAKNPEEYERLNKLSNPAATARALGRFEARFMSKSEPKKKPKVKTKSSAPKPLETVKTGGSSTSTKNPDEMSFQEYKAWRAKKKG